MKKFEYSARNAEGAIQRGDMEGNDRTEVVKILQDRGLIVVKVEEKVKLLGSFNEINLGGVPMDEKVIFMRQLATMIAAGLPLSHALEILSVQAKNALFKRVLREVLADVEGGKGLADSFKKHPNVFDDIVLNLLKAGEDSGKLEEVCIRLADQLEHDRDFQTKVKSAMIYPIIIVVVIIVVVALVMLFMIPAVSGIYEEFGGQMPLVTRILISMSNFTRSYWWLVLIVLVSAVAGFKYYIDTPKGRYNFDKLKLKAPIFGNFNTKIQLATFTQTLFLLVSSGISILDALELVSESLGNSLFKAAVKNAAKEVEKGSSLALPLSRTEWFPLIVSQMVGVGEETGKLDEVLKKMSEYYNNEVKVMADNMATLIEPLMLIIMGSVIGFIAVAVYMPLFSLANIVQ